jgi:hypothetical protein
MAMCQGNSGGALHRLAAWRRKGDEKLSEAKVRRDATGGNATPTPSS